MQSLDIHVIMNFINFNLPFDHKLLSSNFKIVFEHAFQLIFFKKKIVRERFQKSKN